MRNNQYYDPRNPQSYGTSSPYSNPQQPYGQPQSYGQPSYSYGYQTPPPQYNPQPKAPMHNAPRTWGANEFAQRPWYLQTWFIALMASLWFFGLPLIVVIILLVMQSSYDKKMTEQYKTIQNAESYWACVKEDCARIYQEATEKHDALIKEGLEKKQLTEQKAKQYLLQVDRQCKEKRAATDKEIQELLEQRDLLREEVRQLRRN